MRDSIIVSNVACAIICAKWGLDLGYSQVSQFLLLLGGLIFGPLALLILYVRLIYRAGDKGETSGRMV